MNVNQHLNRRFLTQLLATPKGRAHILSHAADARATARGPSSIACSR